jgi:hypothetical protein
MVSRQQNLLYISGDGRDQFVLTVDSHHPPKGQMMSQPKKAVIGSRIGEVIMQSNRRYWQE